MRQTAPLWTLPLALVLGISIGILLPPRPTPFATTTPDQIPPGAAFLVVVDPAQPTPAVFVGSNDPWHSQRRLYTFRDRDAAHRACIVAAESLASSVRQAMSE